MEKIYFYKIVADDGGAPCVDGGRLLSLAICKPGIRSTAKKGDLVFGFAGKSLHKDNRLIYVAKITKKVCNGDYFKEGRYFRRQDCIYSFKSGRFKWRSNASHHSPKDLIHDLGNAPHYRRANVLLSDDFRYFGQNGTDEYKSKFPRLKNAVEKLMRGYRVRLNSELREEMIQMTNWIWTAGQRKVAGIPTSNPSRTACHRTGSCQVL